VDPEKAHLVELEAEGPVDCGDSDEDVLAGSNHDTASEHEADVNESEIREEEEINKNVLLGRDGVTKWRKCIPFCYARTRE
jgi:hypothetical protein